MQILIKLQMKPNWLFYKIKQPHLRNEPQDTYLINIKYRTNRIYVPQISRYLQKSLVSKSET